MALNCCPAPWCWPWPLLDMDTAAGARCCQAGDTAALALAWPLRALSPESDSTTGMCGECQHTALENGKKTAKGKHYLGFFFCEKLKKKKS